MKKIYTNGNIITLDRRYSNIEAVVVENGKIKTVGSNELLKTEGKNAEIVDLHGATLLPAFMIFSSAVNEKQLIECGVTAVIDANADMNLYSDNKYKLDYFVFSDYAKRNCEGVDICSNIKHCGYSLCLDGDLTNRSAYVSTPYYVVPDGELLSYSGESYCKYIDVKKYITDCSKNRKQMLVMATGDAAIDQFLRGYEKVYVNKQISDYRNILVNCQTVRNDQLDRIRMLKLFINFNLFDLYKYGSLYCNSILGEARAYKLVPMQSSVTKGIPITVSHKCGNIIESIYFACGRYDASGKLIGKQERITPLRMVKTLTINAAYSVFQEDMRGSITPQKIADFCVLNKNPCKVRFNELKDIKVLETIKEGRTIYKYPG